MSGARRPAGASAPGKLMISGEYAVLEGSPAIVAAVQTRASVRFVAASAGTVPPEVRAARLEAERLAGPIAGALALDVSALRREGRKLGLGSSAAGAAAAAAAVLAWHGRDVTAPEERRRVLACAMAGHRSVAPEGSGADVAASVLGGFVRYRRSGDDYEAEAVPWPTGLVARVVWTGKEARTSDLVRAVRSLGERDPATLAAAMGALDREARAFVAAFEAGVPTEVVAAVAAHGRAMAALGRAAGAPIVEERLEEIATLAARAGGAAKPSGAGGGDVALALFGSEADAEAFDRSCAERGLTRVAVVLGGPGVLPIAG